MCRIFLCALLCGVVVGTGVAEVTDSATTGFTVKITRRIQASPSEVYRRLIRIADWWNPEHTYSGDSRNLTIEERAGGCFCEKLAEGGSVNHMTVLFVQPGKFLRLGGGLGPLQGIASTGTMTIQIAPAEGDAQLKIVYTVTGYLPTGMAAWADPVNSVLTEQFTRLGNLIERGDPAKSEPAK